MHKPKRIAILDQIKTWSNRAEMAKQQGNGVLLEKALEYKRKYEDDLAKLDEFEIDDSDQNAT